MWPFLQFLACINHPLDILTLTFHLVISNTYCCCVRSRHQDFQTCIAILMVCHVIRYRPTGLMVMLIVNFNR